MPELPEVETIRRALAPRLEGARIVRLEILDDRWCAPEPPTALAAELDGRRIERVERRGKYLVVALEGERFLVMHLRMTGTLLLDPAGGPPAHTRVRVHLGGGSELAFVDPRRFGTGVVLVGAGALAEHLAPRVGVEPLSDGFTLAHLRALARGCRAPVKAFLLDQRRVAGVGNIYADEALFRAGIHPLRPAGTLTRAQLEALRLGVVDALRAGIAAKGATIDDFRDPEGARGSFQDQFLVHRRRGEDCPTCGSTVLKLVAAGRGTYVCPRCQPAPRRRAGVGARRARAAAPA